MVRWTQPWEGRVRLPAWKASPPEVNCNAHGIGSLYVLLMTFGPPFHITVNVPRGVAFAVPGGPGSMRTGPKVTLPSDCSQVRCLDRSTQAAAADGHAPSSRVVSARDPGAGGMA